MTQQLMDRFLDALHARYPDYPLSVREYSSPDDPSIEYFIDILLVPEDQLHGVAWNAWSLAEEVYGEQPTRFLMTAVDPSSSIEYFSAELAESRSWLNQPVEGDGFPITLVSQSRAEPILWNADDFVTLCAALAAAYWTSAGWDVSAGSDELRPPTVNCELGGSDSIVLPDDLLGSRYALAA